MKRFISFICLSLIVWISTACNTIDVEPTSQDKSVFTSSIDSSVSSLPISSAPIDPAFDPTGLNFAGVYFETSHIANSSDYSRKLELHSDSTFTFHVNLAVGMGTIEGTYAIEDDVIECAVSNINFSGFAGDDVTDFSFTIVDEIHLKYNERKTYIAYLDDGLLFEKIDNVT